MNLNLFSFQNVTGILSLIEDGRVCTESYLLKKKSHLSNITTRSIQKSAFPRKNAVQRHRHF